MQIKKNQNYSIKKNNNESFLFHKDLELRNEVIKKMIEQLDSFPFLPNNKGEETHPISVIKTMKNKVLYNKY